MVIAICCLAISHVQLFATPWTATPKASLSVAISRGLLKFMFIESVMLSNYLLCYPLLLWLQSFPETGSFTVSQFFASCCQNTGASTSASVLPMNIQGWFPLGLTDLILQSKILSRVFSSTVWKHQFFSAQPSFGEGNDNPLQYSCLENPMDRVAWRVTNRVAKSSWGRKELDTTEAT